MYGMFTYMEHLGFISLGHRDMERSHADARNSKMESGLGRDQDPGEILRGIDPGTPF